MNMRPREIIGYGLWSGNAGLVQLLGLCPLLAVSNNAVNALGLGLATLIALLAVEFCVSAVRRLSRREIRIPLFVTIIATVVTSIELAMHAWLPGLHAVLGLFVPLIVTNCALMGRAEAFAARQPPGAALLDALGMGVGFLLLLLVLGAGRELIGQGSLFAGAGRLLGLPWLEWHPAQGGLLIAMLPPGAFLMLAALIAAKQRIERSRAERTSVVESASTCEPG
ncbi:electron transport complex subunit RsxE [Pseudomarimonas arenosa]|uniref:Ion-translocating oxidoreductase complex subunit E n=1 Tax=Pseudomarimonas arenosa TaxID=2774145 RepID=A0AAW3ZKD3_9GAMM|nr:electron transport complex subunit RsxE [Pseudomarimonas arenosa]MBD8526545.1 electron transport complex subunit RsxE [Pseudomarimonas arenosa]